jgi:hypothetical protein
MDGHSDGVCSGAYTLKVMAAYVGVHPSTVSRAVKGAQGQKRA